MKIIIRIIFIFYCCSVFGQQEKITEKYKKYSTLLAKGVVEMNSLNYTKAISYFDSASIEFPYFHKPYFQSVICAAQTDNYQVAYDYAVKTVLTGIKLGIIPEALGKFSNTALYKQFLQKEDSLYNTAIQQHDTLFCNPLITLYNIDQNNIGKSKNQRDTTVFHQFVELCQKYGFPTCKNVGMELYRKAVLITHNSAMYGYPDSEDWKKLIQIISKEEKRGHIEPGILCGLEDIYLYENNLPVKYGTWFRLRQYYPNMKFPSLDEINRNRDQVGIESFELYLAIIGVELVDALKEIEM